MPHSSNAGYITTVTPPPAAIADPESAIQALRNQHDLLVNMLAATTDLVAEVQQGRQVRAERLRQACGHTIRKSLIEREAALAVLAPDRELAELVLAQYLLDTMTAADEPQDADIIELCKQRMPAFAFANTQAGANKPRESVAS